MNHAESSLETDAESHVGALIDITLSLSAIVEQENEALVARRTGDIAPLQAEKARLAAAYAQSIRAVAANRAAASSADPGLLSRLRALTESFEAMALRQRDLLDGSSAPVTGN